MQRCAVVSASRHNPNGDVILWTTHHLQHAPTTDNFSQLIINIEYIFACQKEIRVWLFSRLSTRNVPSQRRSTLVILYKYGGVYMDLGMVSLKTLEHNDFNLGWEIDDVKMGSAFMQFERHHPSLLLAMKHYVADLQDVFAWQGPVLMNNTVNRYRNSYTSPKILIAPKSAFFPVPYERFGFLFRSASTTANLNFTYVLHTWNYMQMHPVKRKLEIETNSVLNRVMHENCPS